MAEKKATKIRFRSKAKKLITDNEGNVIGLEYSAIPSYSLCYMAHRLLTYINYKTRYVLIGMPALNKVFEILYSILEVRGRTRRVKARKGVILAAGGFIFNRKMVKEIAPIYLPGTPLGTLGDNGSGIKLGEAVGGATAHMNRISAWRFITPPESIVKGVLVDQLGRRICNEQLYGAQMGEYMVENHDGEAWLIIDSDIWKTVRADTGWGKARWFQTMTSLVNLYINRKKAKSIEQLEKKCDIPTGSLTDTINAYNDAVAKSKADAMSKAAHHVQPIEKPPFYAINCDLGNTVFPCATISLGGLAVNEETSEVKRVDGSVINGLYAAGRNAAGIPSKGYVSGLAIAHCIFSGRQAGRHAATKSV